MKSIALIALLALGLVSRVAAVDAPKTDAPPADAVVFDHTQVVDNAFAKGLPILVTTNYKIQASRRPVAGTVEIHEHDTDIFLVTEGSATLITGGKAIGMKPTASGELRGDKIEGGVSRKVSKGDVIVVPQGVPHWFSAVDGVFGAFVVKVTK